MTPSLQGMANLPCHPDACETCQGLDVVDGPDGIVPCPDTSWCQAYRPSGAGFVVCRRPIDHEGKHRCGATEWLDPPMEEPPCPYIDGEGFHSDTSGKSVGLDQDRYEQLSDTTYRCRACNETIHAE